jgi:rubrerythrin
MQILSFLEEAAVLEETISSCYRALGERVSEAALRKDFERLADEKRNHALVIRTGKNYFRKEPDLFGETILDQAELAAGLQLARAILEAIRSNETIFREAVKRLREMEIRFEKLHVDTVMPVRDESLRELFRQLARIDLDHRLVLDRILGET